MKKSCIAEPEKGNLGNTENDLFCRRDIQNEKSIFLQLQVEGGLVMV